MADEAELNPPDDGKPAVDDSPEAGIEALRQQMATQEESHKKLEAEASETRRALEGERAAREEAERRARHASAEAQRGAQTVFEAQYDSVVNAHAAAQGELVSAKNALKAAMAEGDFEKVADLAAEIGVAAARVRRFEEGKTELDQRRQNPTASPPYTTGQEDQRETFIRSRTPRTAAWLRRNDRYFTDQNFSMAVTGAHHLAVARGIQADSDEYFRFIEEQAGLRQAEAPPAPPPAPTATTAAAATTARSSPTPAAPPAGSTASSARPSAASGTITLSPQEREVCRINGISEAAYAKQKSELMAEGRIGTGH